MILRRLWASSLALASYAIAQFPPTPEGVTTKHIASHPGVSISYKATKGFCEPNARSWAGYVHMPSSYLSEIESSDPYNVSMFFWYVEARNNPENAPTGIYLAGGPGESSMDGATSDGGPCYINSDSNSTRLNEFSYNNHVNMLYIDQPVGAGFSYDVLVKSTLDVLIPPPANPLKHETQTGIKAFSDYDGDVPPPNSTFLHGIFPSQNPLHTANTTEVAAITVGKFAQIWFSEFPEYCTDNKLVSLWGNSWGGYWVTGTAAYIQKQNEKIKSGDISGKIIHLDTIGMTNGCFDMLYQISSYPKLAYDNVYNFPVISKATYDSAMHNLTKKDGCLDAIEECRALGEKYDPREFAINAKVNEACELAQEICSEDVIFAYANFPLPHAELRSQFDMAQITPAPLPLDFAPGFFNQEWVQKTLGVPVNFTDNSILSDNVFLAAGADAFARAGMKDFEYLLDSGVKAALIYGDRDYRCPWLGMEKLSLAANWTGAEKYRNAGYEYIHTNATYDGGMVKQHGNLSFSRVFQAGHDAYWFQPETVYRAFERAMFDKDVATGKISTSGASNDYSTSGPLSCYNVTLELPSPPPVECYTWLATGTCTGKQQKALAAGTAEIKDYRVIKPVGKYPVS